MLNCNIVELVETNNTSWAHKGWVRVKVSRIRVTSGLGFRVSVGVEEEEVTDQSEEDKRTCILLEAPPWMTGTLKIY